MELFDKKFVFLEWDDSLEGKKVFIADTLPELRRRINLGSIRWLVRKHDGDHPFVIEGSYAQYAMVYYDPNYECKIAYKQGKVIQYRSKDSSEPWIDCFKEPSWCDDVDYRVKPEDSKCNTCSYQCEPDMPCNTCRDGSNYKPRVVVKPKHKRRMTYREFAKWVAQGNGQVKNIDGCYITSRGVEYDIGDDDKSCPDRLLIRGWDEEEWHEPEVEE